MAFELKGITAFGMEYKYWNIDSFTVSYSKGVKVVDVIFAAYIDEEARRNGAEPYERKSQQIPFEEFMQGFKDMVLGGLEFTEENIKEALYGLKLKYDMFREAEDC